MTGTNPLRPRPGRDARDRADRYGRADSGARAPVTYARRPPAGGQDGLSESGGRPLSRSSLWDDIDAGNGSFSGPQPLRARWDPVPPPRERVGRRRTRTERRRSSLGWFVHHYGWRAYAIPVLAVLSVVTIIGLVTPHGDAGSETTAPPAESSSVVTVTLSNSVVTTVTIAAPTLTPTAATPPQPQRTNADAATAAPGPLDVAAAHAATELPPTPPIDRGDAFRGVVMGVLPPGAPFAETGAGTFHVIPGTSEPLGNGPDRRTFTIEVEDGVQSTAADAQFAGDVMAILSSDQSWVGTGDFTLQRVDSGNPDFRITLTSQMTTRQADFCGWDVQLEASCYNYLPGRVVINDARWARGAYAYNGDLTSYRVYAINHEVGHALGFNHLPCSANNAPAPVMMQQSWSTSDNDIAALNPGGPVRADGKICRANPFVIAH